MTAVSSQCGCYYNAGMMEGGWKLALMLGTGMLTMDWTEKARKRRRLVMGKIQEDTRNPFALGFN